MQGVQRRKPPSAPPGGRSEDTPGAFAQPRRLRAGLRDGTTALEHESHCNHYDTGILSQTSVIVKGALQCQTKPLEHFNVNVSHH